MTNIVVEGKAGIRVEVVLHSISEAGKEIITFLVDHPRIVHAEELKHRQFSYSAASSRAIPFDKMEKQLSGIPVQFGKNQSGMQAGGEHNELINGMYTPEEWWKLAKLSATNFSRGFAEAGYHKQISGRLTEPFQMIRVLVTATETENFYWLRDDKAADPTLAEQAKCMREAHLKSKPQVLKAGEWHLPFVPTLRNYSTKKLMYCEEITNHHDNTPAYEYYTLGDAIKVSCARCAATSFRNTDYDLAKSLQVYDRLVNGDKIHAGALEHQASPMKDSFSPGAGEWADNDPGDPESWEQGISHVDRSGQFWSGNFAGWVQYRKLVPGECYKGSK